MGISKAETSEALRKLSGAERRVLGETPAQWAAPDGWPQGYVQARIGTLRLLNRRGLAEDYKLMTERQWLGEARLTFLGLIVAKKLERERSAPFGAH